MDGTIYRCNEECPINKTDRCFVIKTAEPIDNTIKVLHKCKVTKKDILLVIGNKKS